VPQAAPPPVLNYHGLNSAFLLTAADVDNFSFR